MSAKAKQVHRPLKKSEHEIRFATNEADKRWRDLVATQRNAAVEAWEFLTATPTQESPRSYPLRGDLATVTRAGEVHIRWQYKLTGGARIWYSVHTEIVYLVDVHTHHPNQTKR